MTHESEGALIEGVPVHGWATQSEIADWFGYTGRHIQNLEERGLPNTGAGATKAYPIPHATVWLTRYRVHQALGDVVERLPFTVAYAEHVADRAESEGDLRIHRRGA